MVELLFISGSFGLGHVFRDLAIADEIRRLRPNTRVSWLAGDPARQVIADAGETLLPEAALYASDSDPAEAIAQNMHANLVQYALRARQSWLQNVRLFRQVLSQRSFDAVVGDETYELAIAMLLQRRLCRRPFTMIYDFLGFEPREGRAMERLGVWLLNRVWTMDWCVWQRGSNQALFVGEVEDVPDRALGWRLPRAYAYAKAHYRPLGYVLPFDVGLVHCREETRAELGYGREPLIVCSIGGTRIAKGLLDLCGQAYPILRESLPDLCMVLVCGPRLSPNELNVPPGPEVRGYVPQLYRHLAAADLAIVHGGGSITLELTALRTPFLFFPVEGHSEQEVSVTTRIARHGAGVRMAYSQTTPKVLAEAALAQMGREATYPPIPTDGARVAAELIVQRLPG